MLGRLAPGQEAGEGGHLPDLAVDTGRGLDDREIHVRTDVEDDGLQRRDVCLDALEQLDHRLFQPRVDAERMRFAALRADLGGQVLKVGGVAADDDSGQAFAREASGDGAAQGVPGPDDQHGLLRHRPLSRFMLVAIKDLLAGHEERKTRPYSVKRG